MNILVDHNLAGYAVLIAEVLANGGWLELISIRFVTFAEVDLATNSSDRVVWQVAQDNQMILLSCYASNFRVSFSELLVGWASCPCLYSI